MIVSFYLRDLLSLTPLLITLFGALLVLIIQTFLPKQASVSSFWTALTTTVIAGWTAFYIPGSENTLLTNWLTFDSLSHFFALFFTAVTFFSLLLSSAFFKTFKATAGEYYFFLLTALFGLLLIGHAADFLTLFLGLETLSIALYILCGYMKKWQSSNESSLKYFLIGAIGAAFLLYGIAFIYGAIGTLRFDQLLTGYQSLQTPYANALFFTGIAFITAGLAFKAAIVPFHVWSPDVYCGSPTPVTTFMAIGVKAGAMAAFARLFLVALPDFNLYWNDVIALLAYPTLIYANFVALRQTQLRRFFAYSGISHAGFLLFPLAAGGPDALPSLLFYLTIYGFATIGAFSVLTLIDKEEESPFIDSLKGLFAQAPFAALVMSISMLTLAGIPPTAGFLAKLYIFKSAFATHHYALVITGLLTAIVAAAYYLKIVNATLTKTDKPLILQHSWETTLTAAVSLIGIIGLSIYSEPFLNYLNGI